MAQKLTAQSTKEKSDGSSLDQVSTCPFTRTEKQGHKKQAWFLEAPPVDETGRGKAFPEEGNYLELKRHRQMDLPLERVGDILFGATGGPVVTLQVGKKKSPNPKFVGNRIGKFYGVPYS